MKLMKLTDNLRDVTSRFQCKMKTNPSHFQKRKNHGISQIIVDPGIGFGKRLQDNLEILRRLQELRGLGYPVLLGPSRKSFIGKILDVESDQRVMGTAAAVALGLNNGAKIIRVHDIQEMKQISQTVEAINNSNFFSKD